MSISLIGFALSGNDLLGEDRLAYISVADSGGYASVTSVAKWCNVSLEDAQEIILGLFRRGFLAKSNGRYFSGEMLRLLELERPEPKAKEVKITRPIRDEVYARDDFKCHYCGAPKNLTLDHKIPRHLGGGDEVKNLVTACRSCNSKKGVKPYDVFISGMQNQGAPE